jgi:hypothetical protein
MRLVGGCGACSFGQGGGAGGSHHRQLGRWEAAIRWQHTWQHFLEAQLPFGLWQNPIDWLRHAGAKSREEVDYSAARQDTSSDRDCLFDQKEESSTIGTSRAGSVEDRQFTGRGPGTQRESPKVRGIAGHIEQAERGAICKSPQAHKHFFPLLPTAMVFVSYGFVLVLVQGLMLEPHPSSLQS